MANFNIRKSKALKSGADGIGVRRADAGRGRFVPGQNEFVAGPEDRDPGPLNNADLCSSDAGKDIDLRRLENGPGRNQKRSRFFIVSFPMNPLIFFAQGRMMHRHPSLSLRDFFERNDAVASVRQDRTGHDAEGVARVLQRHRRLTRRLCSLDNQFRPPFYDSVTIDGDPVHHNAIIRRNVTVRFNVFRESFAAVHLYLNPKAFDKKDCCGVVVLFVREDIAPELVKAIGQKGLDDDDQEIILDAVGEFCNAIVGQFKEELRSFGYLDLMMSTPIKFRNDASDGIPFPYEERKLLEISFYVKKDRAIVVNVVLASNQT